MKRFALLIGYTGKDDNNYLSAVENDLKRYKKFLQSSKGGLWNENEIETIIDGDKSDITHKLDIMRLTKKYDFVYTVYSGHGIYTDCQCLGVNKDDYTLTENDFSGLAKRQISVFDACANIYCNESIDTLMEEAEFSESSMLSLLKRQEIRGKYEKQILQCPEQEIRLYSAMPDESASANSYESYYIGELLKAFNNVEESTNIIKLHEIAEKEVIKRSLDKQHPRYKVKTENIVEEEYLMGVIDELF